MIKKYVLSILSFIFGIALFAQADINFSVSYFDKKIYYTGDRIELSFKIENKNSEPFIFNLAENHVFGFDLEVITLLNQPLPHSEQYIRSQTENQPFFYRNITLLPGESFSFNVFVDSFIVIDQPGNYIIRAKFKPRLESNNSEQLVSNNLSLAVRARSSDPAAIARIDEATGEILEKLPLPPDEVVSYLINARQRSQWNRFFLYLDLEKLYLRSPGAQVRYSRMNEVMRQRQLREFKTILEAEEIDDAIISIPYQFEIVSTRYTPTTAHVVVNQRFRYPDYTEIKEYTYVLQRDDLVWLVVDYSVRSLGTE